MKVLVTGASGFIGYNLSKELDRRHVDVIGLVRRTSKTDKLEDINVPLVVSDLNDLDDLKDTLSRVKPDIVIHSAARVFKGGADEYYRTNALGTENICSVCCENNVKRLVHISSIAAINGNEERPLKDNMPLNAKNSYGESKLEAEKIVNAWRQRGLKCAIVRPCMVYGEQEPHMFKKLMKAVKRRFLPIVDAPIMDRRIELGYIENVVDVIILCMRKAEALEGSFIARDKEGMTYRELISVFYEELTSSVPPKIPHPLFKMMYSVPPLQKKIDEYLPERTYEANRSIEVLGWDGGVPTREALKRTLAYWKKKLEEEG